MLRKLDRAVQLTLSYTRLLRFRLLYPRLKVGRRVEIGAGVRIILRRDGRAVLGDRVQIEPNCLIESCGDLEIGAYSFIGQGSVVTAAERVVIGPDALIAANVTIRDQNHRTDGIPYRLQGNVAAPISIGSNVWLGAGAVVLKGVSIGDNSIVGANAVVTKSLGESVTAVGIPAVERGRLGGGT